VACVFATVVFLVCGWAMIWFFQKMPGWQPYLNAWDIMSILAYALAFALLESLIALGLLVALAAVLPVQALRAQFAACGSTIVVATTFWTVMFQLIFEAVIRDWRGVEFVLWPGLAFVSIITSALLVHRSRRAQRMVVALADRFTVFLYLYVPLGVAGALVVVARNLL
jgi:hypothetical protein